MFTQQINFIILNRQSTHIRIASLHCMHDIIITARSSQERDFTIQKFIIRNIVHLSKYNIYIIHLYFAAAFCASAAAFAALRVRIGSVNTSGSGMMVAL